jgi:hypothetical protein
VKSLVSLSATSASSPKIVRWHKWLLQLWIENYQFNFVFSKPGKLSARLAEFAYIFNRLRRYAVAFSFASAALTESNFGLLGLANP